MSFFEALLTNPILQMALLAALGASFAGGLIGSYVVIKRIVSIAGSISHSVLSGMGAALYFQRVHGINWLTPLLGAIIAAIFSSLVIGWVHLRFKDREDAIIAMIWSLGMAVGVIFVSQTPGFNVELTHFLLGNILWVSPSDLILLFCLNIFIFISIFLFYKPFLAVCFDEKQAHLQGLPVHLIYLFLLILVGISVVILIYVVGIILVLSLLALPPSIAGVFTRKLSSMMAISVLLNMVFSVGGLALSYRLDWPAGATIALFATVIYLLSLRFRRTGYS